MTDHEGHKKLNEIMEGLDGVTPGPWVGTTAISSTMGAPVVAQTGTIICNITPAPQGFPGKEEIDRYQLANIAHIARCSPETFRAIAALVEELEEKLKDVGVECALRGVRLESKDAEIEKQRSDASYWCTANNAAEAIIKAKDAEIERLREALLTIKDMSPQQVEEDFEHRLVAERVLKETQS